MTFTGFPKGGDRFFQELAAEMNREWFVAHKDEYESLWRAPMQALLEDVRAKLVGKYKGVGLREPKIFRINRDVRFAKDKSPYKTHIAGVVMCGDGEGTPAALYVSLGGHEASGAGIWQLEPEQLVRWRKLVLDAKKGAELAKLAAGNRVEAHGKLARPPKGFPPDHPRVELAKMKGITVTFPAIPKGLIYKPAFAGWLAEQASAAAPLCTWIAKNV